MLMKQPVLAKAKKTIDLLVRRHPLAAALALALFARPASAEGVPSPAELASARSLCNEARNVVGLMPHPERACESMLGSADGLVIFESVVQALKSGVMQEVAR